MKRVYEIESEKMNKLSGKIILLMIGTSIENIQGWSKLYIQLRYIYLHDTFTNPNIVTSVKIFQIAIVLLSKIAFVKLMYQFRIL